MDAGGRTAWANVVIRLVAHTPGSSYACHAPGSSLACHPAASGHPAPATARRSIVGVVRRAAHALRDLPGGCTSREAARASCSAADQAPDALRVRAGHCVRGRDALGRRGCWPGRAARGHHRRGRPACLAAREPDSRGARSGPATRHGTGGGAGGGAAAALRGATRERVRHQCAAAADHAAATAGRGSHPGAC